MGLARCHAAILALALLPTACSLIVSPETEAGLGGAGQQAGDEAGTLDPACPALPPTMSPDDGFRLCPTLADVVHEAIPSVDTSVVFQFTLAPQIESHGLVLDGEQYGKTEGGSSVLDVCRSTERLGVEMLFAVDADQQADATKHVLLGFYDAGGAFLEVGHDADLGLSIQSREHVLDPGLVTTAGALTYVALNVSGSQGALAFRDSAEGASVSALDWMVSPSELLIDGGGVLMLGNDDQAKSPWRGSLLYFGLYCGGLPTDVALERADSLMAGR